MIVAEGVVALGPPGLHSELQWGRNLIVAEGKGMGSVMRWPKRLQWGRNLIVAEGARQITNEARRLQASMGPQLDSCGRLQVSAWGPNTVGFNGAAT